MPCRNPYDKRLSTPFMFDLITSTGCREKKLGLALLAACMMKWKSISDTNGEVTSCWMKWNDASEAKS